MSFSASFEIGSKFLAGNPIPLKINVTPGYNVTYRVKDATSAVVFTGLVSSITGSQTLNINKLFEHTSVTDGVKTYTLELEHEETVLQTATIYVYAGAISKRLYRELAKQSLTIFGTKLDSSTSNYFLTTRSFSKIVTIPEDELMPLYYYSGTSVQSLDLAGTRLSTYNSTGAINNVITVGSAVTFVITDAVRKHDNYIKFRNSLGAYEKIALEKTIEFYPVIEQENADVYDRMSDDVLSLPFRTDYTARYRADLRQMRADEALFVLDMLLSREQYLVTPNGEFQVQVKMSDQVLQSTSGLPSTISVEITSVEEEHYYSPINMEQLGLIYENIFTSEFTNQYT